MAKIHMPEARKLASSLGQMVGKVVRVTEAKGPNAFDASVHTARYWTKDDRLAALIQMDLALAAFLGASLALVPAAGAEESVAGGALDENLTDAYGEVANIMSSLICQDGSPHVRCTSVVCSSDALEAPDKALIEGPCARLDASVEVEGYGSGLLTILAAKLG